MVNKNPRICGVVHVWDPRPPVTSYNATRWRARCGTSLLGTEYADAPIDCMTCLVLEARGK